MVTNSVYLGPGYDRSSLVTAAWFVSADTRLVYLHTRERKGNPDRLRVKSYPVS